MILNASFHPSMYPQQWELLCLCPRFQTYLVLWWFAYTLNLFLLPSHMKGFGEYVCVILSDWLGPHMKCCWNTNVSSLHTNSFTPDCTGPNSNQIQSIGHDWGTQHHQIVVNTVKRMKQGRKEGEDGESEEAAFWMEPSGWHQSRQSRWMSPLPPCVHLCITFQAEGAAWVLVVASQETGFMPSRIMR